jgi:hypothetical protein
LGGPSLPGGPSLINQKILKRINMKALLFLSLFTSTLAFADQAVTLRCTGEEVILKVKTPYLGDAEESAKFQQQLYVLTTPETEDESRKTAYFLDVEYDVGKFGDIYISGKNEVGGSFDLHTSHPVDVSDGTVIQKKSSGTLSYKHGPLKGKKVKVDCTEE